MIHHDHSGPDESDTLVATTITAQLPGGLVA